MTTTNEQKLPRFISVDVMGDMFKVPMCCIKRIPLLKAIAEEHPGQTIEIDEVSPDFFGLLIEFLKNRNESKFLESIKIFRKEDVDYCNARRIRKIINKNFFIDYCINEYTYIISQKLQWG